MPPYRRATLAAILLLVAITLAWQGTHGGKIYLLWAGRTSFMLSTSPDHTRLLLQTYPDVQSLPRPMLGYWRPTPLNLSGGMGPPIRPTNSTTSAFNHAAYAAPIGGYPIHFLGFHAIDGQTARDLFSSRVSYPATCAMLDVPHWFPIATFLLFLARYAHRIAKSLARAPGTCPHCGYDRRASAARCPECGSAIPAVSGPAMPRLLPHLQRNTFAYSLIVFLATLMVLQWKR